MLDRPEVGGDRRAPDGRAARGSGIAAGAFAAAIGNRDQTTIAAYQGVLRDFVAWLATRPSGRPFRVELLTETAVRDYLEYLRQAERAPRTRAKALTVIRRFCRWAVDEGLLRRNPANGVERPTVAALAPTELTADQRYVLHQLVDRAASPRRAPGPRTPRT